MIQQVRAYWDSRPCNILHSFAPIGSKQWSREVTERKYFVEPHIPAFAQFSLWKEKRVMEVGCGIGTDTLSFARAGAEVTAIDLSRESLNLAAERAAHEGLGIIWQGGDVERLNWWFRRREFSYDLIYSFGVLHHTPDPFAALRQLRLYITHDGTLKLMLYHRWSLKALTMWLRGRRISDYSEAKVGCPVTHVYSRREARALLERAGWRVTNMRVAHIFPYQLAAYKRYEYKFTWWRRLLPDRVFHWLEGIIGWHILIDAEVVW